MSAPTVGQKVYLNSTGSDSPPYYIVRNLRWADTGMMADLEPWPFGRTTLPNGQPDTLSTIGISYLSVAGSQTL